MKGKQFVVWQLVPNPAKSKPDKIPFNPLTGRFVDPHDPTGWMTESEARALAAAHPITCAGVMYILTRDDGYACLDLDHAAMPDGTWSPFAQSILARFPGAFVELSYSGDGLHVWLKGDAPVDHKTRNKDTPGLEVYTTARAIALGSQGVGDAETNHTAALCAVIEQYVPGSKTVNAAWTTGPCDEWSGPDDDDELINRMLNAKAGLKAMMGGATLRDMWDRNIDALAKSYPTATPGEEFGASEADIALCNHLAWWTGRDCVRMDRLFRRSGLMRPKWDRKGYSTETITNAVTFTASSGVYRQPGADMIAAGVILEPKLRKGVQMLDAAQQMEFFKDCVWVRESNTIMVPDGDLLKQGQFNVAYGGYDLLMDFAGGKSAKSPWEAFTDSRAVTFPKVHGTCFKPDEPLGVMIEHQGRQKINTYQPPIIASEPGDISRVLELIAKQFPNPTDREIILAYAAACVQHPGAKFQWAPIVQGMEGNGKTFIATCVSYAIGLRYCHTPNPRDIANKFNEWMHHTIFAVVEEVHTKDKFDMTEALKSMITQERLEDQKKGADQSTKENCVKYWLTSNYRDAIVKTRTDRRFAPFYTAQQMPGDLKRDGMAGRYFPDLYMWFRKTGHAYMSHFLQNYEIPDALNPATYCNRAPMTSSTPEALAESLGGAEQHILEAVDDGRLGFKGGYVSSHALGLLLEEKRHKINPSKQNKIIRSLDYIPHPGLPNGRTTRCPSAMLDAGKRVTLYVKADDPVCGIIGDDQIIADYVSKQEYNTGPAPSYPVAVAN